MLKLHAFRGRGIRFRLARIFGALQIPDFCICAPVRAMKTGPPASELHDTLLQSVQGLVLRFQSVANRLPPGEPARAQLESALKSADDVIIDGRNRVRGLRGSGKSGDPSAILQELVDAAGFDPPIPIRVVLEGKRARSIPWLRPR